MSSDSSSTGLPASAIAWGKTLGVIAGALALYVGVTFLVTGLTGDPVAGAAASNLAVLTAAILYRRVSTGSVMAGPPRPRATTPGFWAAALAGLVAVWLAGQSAAMWVYSQVGDPAYEAVASAKLDSPAWLLLLTSLVLAPIGEESLLRGVAYPALRRHWPPLAAAFVTASVFALLHMNLVQVVLTIPLGILLAFVYEAAQRLWPVIALHMLFNLAAAVVPVGFVAHIAQPPMIVAALLASTVALYALRPGRYPDLEGALKGEEE